jgi:hypothetical protein
MSEQEPLFDPPTIPAHQRSGWARARAERDQALRVVEENSDPSWADKALEAIRQTALRTPKFFVDDVWEMGLPGTIEDRAIGPVMLRAARLGYCRKTDRVRPSVRSHGSGKPVWESRIYQGEDA